ncbi:NYN domain-containing protein [Moritella marina]|uniref:NYN domain-containing protein n=1 Tax=Moritella marina TaxID=90736 RepID=UPI00370433F5
MNKLNFAVLVDGENASYNDYPLILEEVEKHGLVAIKWVYADWTSPRQSGWKDVLHNTATSPKQQFHYGKDAADHALVMDAIELINKNTRINAVCIVSSDGGFYSLAQRIREHGLHVMAIGQEKTPDRFRKACHNFVYTTNLSASDTSIGQELGVDTLLIAAYKKCAQTNEPVYLGDMGKMLKTLDSSFDPRTYQFMTLKKLIKDKDDIFTIVDEQIDRCFIKLKQKEITSDYKLLKGKIRKWDSLREFGFIETEIGDFHFNAEEIQINEKHVRKGLKVNFKALVKIGTDKNSNEKCPSAYHIEV